MNRYGRTKRRGKLYSAHPRAGVVVNNIVTETSLVLARLETHDFNQCPEHLQHAHRVSVFDAHKQHCFSPEKGSSCRLEIDIVRDFSRGFRILVREVRVAIGPLNSR